MAIARKSNLEVKTNFQPRDTEVDQDEALSGEEINDEVVQVINANFERLHVDWDTEVSANEQIPLLKRVRFDP